MTKNKSFTLIELLVVIVIIGILAGVIIVSTSSSIGKANVAKSKVFAESVRNDLMIGLVSEWKFDDCYESGGIYYTTDFQGISNGWLGLTTCTPGTGSCPTFYDNSEKCVKGGCFYFDGVDDVIYYNSESYPDPGTLTITGWANLSSIKSYSNFFGKAWSDGTGLEINNGKVTFAMYNTSSSRVLFTFDETLSLNQWHFIGGSYDHKTKEVTIFYDGKFYEPNPQNTNSVQSRPSYKLQAGRADGGSTVYRPFHGYIDELAYYTEVLSSEKVREIYLSGLDSLLENGNISIEEYNQRISNIANY